MTAAAHEGISKPDPGITVTLPLALGDDNMSLVEVLKEPHLPARRDCQAWIPHVIHRRHGGGHES